MADKFVPKAVRVNPDGSITSRSVEQAAREVFAEKGLEVNEERLAKWVAAMEAHLTETKTSLLL